MSEMQAPFDVPPPGPAMGPSVFTFAFPRSGSTLLSWLVYSLAEDNGYAPVAPAVRLFERGAMQQDLKPFIQPRGYCYHGFRSNHPGWALDPLLPNFRKILLVRDPRDISVSNYYALLYAHRKPGNGAEAPLTVKFNDNQAQAERLGLDRYCLISAPHFMRMFAEYAPMRDDPKTRLLRYEDHTPSVAKWVQSICAAFDWDCSPERLADLIARFERLPGEENPYEHARQIAPGDYLRKLKPKTIAQLNEIFAPWIERHGYVF